MFGFYKRKSQKDADISHEGDASLLFRAVQKSFDGIALLNFNQTILFANERFWSIYDISVSERAKYMSRPWDSLYSPKGQAIIQNQIYPILEQQSYWSGAEWVKSSTGRKFFADLSIVKYETGYLGLVRDRTDFMKEFEKTKSLTRELHEAQRNEAIIQSVRSMVHDFNNSLSAISGHIDLLEGAKMNSHQAMQSLSYVRASIDKTKSMLAHLRSLIKSTSEGI